MCVNKIKISKILDEPLVAVKKALKDKKERKKYLGLKKVRNNIPPISPIYKTISIDECFANFIAIGSKNMSSLQFFESYISAEYFKKITQYTNINYKLIFEKASNSTLKSDFKHEIFPYVCPWKKTIKEEIEVFFEILFMQNTCKLFKSKKLLEYV